MDTAKRPATSSPPKKTNQRLQFFHSPPTSSLLARSAEEDGLQRCAEDATCSYRDDLAAGFDFAFVFFGGRKRSVISLFFFFLGGGWVGFFLSIKEKDIDLRY